MFTEKMIAPCGLDCSLCSQAQKLEHPCPGCLGPDTDKPEFCSVRCTIIQCEKRKQGGFRFCDECGDYPCGFIQERENRYQTQYALKESPLTNLQTIRTKGMKTFLEQQRKRWSCECGGIISVHEGICGRCGENYTKLPAEESSKPCCP